MVAVIANFKGGVLKSTIAHDLITRGWEGIDLDPYGNLQDRFPELVYKLDLVDELPSLEGLENNVVIDSGAFHDPRLDELVHTADLLILPFVPTAESLQTTVDTLRKLNPSIPVLFVVSLCTKKQDELDSMTVLREAIGYEAEYMTIPFSEGVKTAIKENVGVSDLANRVGLAGSPYRHIAKVFTALEEKILSFKGKKGGN